MHSFRQVAVCPKRRDGSGTRALCHSKMADYRRDRGKTPSARKLRGLTGRRVSRGPQGRRFHPLVRPPQAGATSVAYPPTRSHDRLRSGEPLSMLTSILRNPKIIVAQLLAYRPTTCQSVSMRSFSNIPGQYSTNIPASTWLAHSPSAGLRTPFPPRFKTWV
jgi:hypothetical protein